MGERENECDMLHGNVMGAPVLRLVVVIIDWDRVKKATEILRQEFVRFMFVMNGMGSASSDIMDVLGIGSVDKGVMLFLHPDFLAPGVIRTLSDRLELNRPGSGIVFTLPLSGVSNPFSHLFNDDKFKEFAEAHGHGRREQLEHMFKRHFDKGRFHHMNPGDYNERKEDITHDLILAVVNEGYCDDVMDVAKAAGAKSGTILHARRSGMEDAVKFFGISLQAEKEVVAILAGRDIKTAIMKAVNQSFGMATEARGIVFSLPVDSICGVDLE